MKKNSYADSFFLSGGIKKTLLQMKILIFLMIIGMLDANAAVYSQDAAIDIQASGKSVREVFKIIESKSNFRFFYNDEFADLNKVIISDFKETRIDEMMASLLANSGLTYKILENGVIVVTPDEEKTLIQQIKITGTVIDAATNEPLPGVNILIEGTQQGVVTDVNGKYSINVPGTGTVLVFSFVGYNPEKIEVAGKSVIDLSLSPEIQSLDEVVVIGYGTREKKDITTSISTLNAKDINNSLAISPELSLQGKSAGIFVESGGGNPNSRPTIRVRGTNSWGVSDPLYVVDGIPLTEYGSGAEGSEGAGANYNQAAVVQDIRGNMNVLSMINPSDIESISVLKDASASAIYGVRAANGVVLITTKKGKIGKPKIDFSLRTGIQNIPKKYSVLNTSEFTSLYTEAYVNNPAEMPNFPSVFDPSSPDYLGDSKTYDWITPMYNKNAQVSDYSVRITGGSEFTNYYVSTGYSRTESPLIRNSMDRYSLATNINTKINRYISTGVNFRISYQKAQDATPNSIEYNASASPWQPIYSVDGTGVNGYEPAVGLTYDPFEATMLWGPETNSNSYGLASMEDNRYTNLRGFGNAFIEIEPIKGLKFKGSIDGDWLNQVRNSWTLYENIVFNQTPADPTVYGDGHSYGNVGQRDSKNTNLIKEFTISYAKILGDHSFDLLFNAMDQAYDFNFVQTSSEQLSSPDPNQRVIEEGIKGYSSGGQMKSKNSLQGYLGRLTYNYKSRYYFDAVVRRDGSSRFAPGHKWGTFPAFSAAWRISDESFMKGLSFMSDLKLRAGWGQIGNQETQGFAYLSLLSRAPHTVFGIDPLNPGRGYFYWGIVSGDFPNPDLSWEKTATTNIGIDGLLFNSLSVTLEYYDKTTDGLIQTSKLPTSAGSQNNPIINIGKVKNSGFEVSLGYRGSLGDLKYNANANLTTIKNNVMHMYDNAPMGAEWGGRTEEGYPLNSLWGYKVGGIFQSEDEVTTYQATTDDKLTSSQHAGDMWFQDINGAPDATHRFFTPGPDGVVDNYDRTFLGKTIPGYFYGLSLSLEYKGFDMSCYFNGVGDVKKINNVRASMEAMSSRGVNQLASVKNRWTPDHHSTSMPHASAADPAGNNRFSDRWIENASYFRLSNIQIGYTVPKINTKVFERARIWVGGSNLFTATAWSGLDPENEEVPIPRVFSVGIDASF
jgi:TonB-dependent starch-binding outer membrane protein SusC